jgi:hypothetical protein
VALRLVFQNIILAVNHHILFLVYFYFIMRGNIISPLFALGALAAPSVPLVTRQNDKEGSLWQPPVGVKWQIVISQPVNTEQSITPSDAPVIDVDLFATSASDIQALHSQGRKVTYSSNIQFCSIAVS